MKENIWKFLKWLLTTIGTGSVMLILVTWIMSAMDYSPKERFTIPITDEVKIEDSYLTPGENKYSLSGKISRKSTFSDDSVFVSINYFISNAFIKKDTSTIRFPHTEDTTFFTIKDYDEIPDSIRSEISWEVEKICRFVSKKEHQAFYKENGAQ